MPEKAKFFAEINYGHNSVVELGTIELLKVASLCGVRAEPQAGAESSALRAITALAMLTQLTFLKAKHERTAAGRCNVWYLQPIKEWGLSLCHNTTHAGETNPCIGLVPYSFSLVSQDKDSQCKTHKNSSSFPIPFHNTPTGETKSENLNWNDARKGWRRW